MQPGFRSTTSLGLPDRLAPKAKGSPDKEPRSDPGLSSFMGPARSVNPHIDRRAPAPHPAGMSQGPLPTAARRYPYNPSLIPPPLRDARPGDRGAPAGKWHEKADVLLRPPSPYGPPADYATPAMVTARQALGAPVCCDPDCHLSGGYAHVGDCTPCGCEKRHAAAECPERKA
jgi:hypothetical protein